LLVSTFTSSRVCTSICILLVSLCTILLSQVSWIVSVNVPVETTSVQQIYIVTTPFYAHLYIRCSYFTAICVVLTIPKIDCIIVWCRRNIFFLLVLNIVCSNNRAKIRLDHRTILATYFLIIWYILLKLNCLALTIVDFESLLIPFHYKQVLQFVNVKHCLNFSIMGDIVLDIRWKVILNCVDVCAILSYHPWILNILKNYEFSNLY